MRAKRLRRPLLAAALGLWPTAALWFISALGSMAVIWPTPAIAGVPGAAHETNPGTAASLSAALITLRDDLVCVRAARELGRALEEAKSAGRSAAVLELSGTAWRSDVVLDIGRTLQSSPLPVDVVLVPNPDGRVGCGQLLAALPAGSVWVTPGLRVTATPADEAWDLVPAGLKRREVVEELTSALDPALERGRLPAELPALLLHPDKPVWLVLTPDSLSAPAPRLAWSDPSSLLAPGEQALAITPMPAGAATAPPRVELSAPAVVAMGLAKGTTASGRELLRGRGVSWSSVHQTSVAVRLEAARREVEDSLQALDRASESIKKDLAVKKGKNDRDDSRLRSVGRGALKDLEQARAILARVEQRIEEYPELVRAPAPGQTKVGGTPAIFASRWRSTIQSRHDKLAKLQEKATSLAAR